MIDSPSKILIWQIIDKLILHSGHSVGNIAYQFVLIIFYIELITMQTFILLRRKKDIRLEIVEPSIEIKSII